MQNGIIRPIRVQFKDCAKVVAAAGMGRAIQGTITSLYERRPRLCSIVCDRPEGFQALIMENVTLRRNDQQGKKAKAKKTRVKEPALHHGLGFIPKRWFFVKRSNVTQRVQFYIRTFREVTVFGTPSPP
jgi:hypothetical protein